MRVADTLCYEADGIAMTALIKGILDNGWYLFNRGWARFGSSCTITRFRRSPPCSG